MKTSVCEICLRSGLLCRSCNEKLKRGEVSESEVAVAGVLLKLSEEKRQLKDVHVKKVIESDDITIIVCGAGDAAKVIGASGQIVRMLEREIGKKVMVVEEEKSEKEFVKNLLKPLHVISVSTVYKHGKEIVRVTANIRKSQRISSSDFSRIMTAVYGKEAEIIGE